MLSKNQQSAHRSELFRHLDGIVTVPSAFVLYEKGITKYLLTNQQVDLNTLAQTFNAHEGYLNVALRVLASQGWLHYEVDADDNQVKVRCNANSEAAFSNFKYYAKVVELLRMFADYHPRLFRKEPFHKLEEVFEHYKTIPADGHSTLNQIRTHIEGVILGPTLVMLGMTGMFHKYFMETRFHADEFHHDAESFERLLNILTYFKLFKQVDGAFEFTEKGFFFAKRATAYGVTVSYIPTLRHLDELIFGDIDKVFKRDGSEEQHVDREMNVWGSGGAHAAYFKVVDEIVIDIFNRPLDEQPRGVLDMGCGNGAFLKHLYQVIANQTLRGKHLDEYPLMLIGVDYNEAALKVTRANLIQADIWAKVIWGDIGDPQRLADDLATKYAIKLENLLNVRTFLDHNRIWEAPQHVASDSYAMSGAYASKGVRLANTDVAQSLKEHMLKWKPFVSKFGLLLIELHTLAPEVTADNLGNTAATAYDATHGYSDQYIIEEEVFKQIMKELELQAVSRYSRKFPDNALATVSVNLFRSE